MLSNTKQKGLTLIETLVYVAIFSMFVVTMASFSDQINSARLRNQTILEINYQGSRIVQDINSTIRNAVSINDPVITNSGTSLSIETVNPLNNPTVFTVATGTLYMQEGTNDLVALTNNRVEVSNLIFSNMSRVSTPGTIRIRFTLKNSDMYIKPEEQYTKDFYGSASIR